MAPLMRRLSPTSHWFKSRSFREILGSQNRLPYPAKVTYHNAHDAVKNVEITAHPDYFRLQITPRGPQTYEAMVTALTAAGLQLEPSHVIHDQIHLIRFKSANVTSIHNFLNTIQTIAPEVEEIKQFIFNDANHISILGPTLAPNTTPPLAADTLMTWTTHGNFQTERNISPQKYVEYRINNRSDVIKKIAIGGYQNGSFTLFVEPQNAHALQILNQAITQAGFEEGLPFITLKTSHLSLLAHFLNTLTTAAPELEPLKQEIARTLNIDLSQTLILPNWNTEGNFNTRITSITRYILRRYISHTSTRIICPIAKVEVCGHDENFLLHIHIREPQNYQRLVDALTRAGLQLEAPQPWASNRISLKNSDLPTITNFLNIVGDGVPEFEEIKQIILTDLRNNPLSRSAPPAPVVSREAQREQRQRRAAESNQERISRLLYSTRRTQAPAYTPTFRHNIASRDDELTTMLNRSMHDTSMAVPREPEAGENHKKIVALGIAEENIPEEFCCPITNYAMTDPVYDPNTPGIKCDRPNILRCLESKANNPFTNTPLTPENLVTDTSLKVVIDFYILNQKRLKAKIESEFMPTRADAKRATSTK